jgi:hypothetical protein
MIYVCDEVMVFITFFVIKPHGNAITPCYRGHHHHQSGTLLPQLIIMSFSILIFHINIWKDDAETGRKKDHILPSYSITLSAIIFVGCFCNYYTLKVMAHTVCKVIWKLDSVHLKQKAIIIH